MLVSAKQFIKDAKAKKYAVPQFNINNLEWTKTVLEVCQAEGSPVFLGVSEGAAKYMGGFEAVVGMVRGLDKSLKITVPVAIHLDHGTSYESCEKALKAGFTSVMIDGSEHPINENVELTKKVVQLAHQYNASVEAEVGTVGGEEDGIVGGINYAKLEECLAISKTGIDMLAASLGSVHGHYAGEPKLGFKEMEQYSHATNLPLVLHGGSGIPDDMIKKAINAGECKINVNTEIQEAFTKGVREYIEAGKDKIGTGYDPRKVLAGSIVKMKEVLKTKIHLFGSNNRY